MFLQIWNTHEESFHLVCVESNSMKNWRFDGIAPCHRSSLISPCFPSAYPQHSEHLTFPSQSELQSSASAALVPGLLAEPVLEVAVHLLPADEHPVAALDVPIALPDSALVLSLLAKPVLGPAGLSCGACRRRAAVVVALLLLER